MELHKSDVNVESFIDSCVSIFHTPARGKDITINLELSDPTVVGSLPVNNTDLISFDKFKMSQVLRNFMSNAMKFTPEGGTITLRACFTPIDMTPPLLFTQQPSTLSSSNIHLLSKSNKSITGGSSKSMSEFFHNSRWRKSMILASSDIDLELGQSNKSNKSNKNNKLGQSNKSNKSNKSNGSEEDGSHAQQGVLRISVIDSGAGISPENQQRLFKEIIQFNPEVLQGGGGSGFGLYICKGIVDLHDGSIDVFSEGRDALHRFLLPNLDYSLTSNIHNA